MIIEHMFNTSLASLLGLSKFKILKIEEYPQKILIHIKPRRKTAVCPCCGIGRSKVHQNLPSQVKKHISIGARQTHLVVYKRRFYCHKCQKTYNEQLDMVNKHQRHTNLLEDEVIRQLKEMSFEATKRTTGIHYQKQVQILKKTMKPFEANWNRERRMKSFSLGMDGHSFSKHDMVLTVTNLNIPRVISILHTDSKNDIDKFLNNIPKNIKQKINAVCIDMSAGYRSSIEKHLSSSKIVIDKFHIIQDANSRIDQERVIINEMTGTDAPKKLFLINKENLTERQQKLIDKWFKKIPDLKTLWSYKEDIRQMYASDDYQQAKRRLDTIISGLYKQQSKVTSDWAKTLERWYEPILNYFDYMITNGYTEGMHTKFKLLKRVGFGFKNKDVYIRKMALGCLPLALLLPH